MIQHGHAQRLGLFAHQANIGDGLRPAVGAGAAVFGQIRHGDVTAADLGIDRKHAVGVGDHVIQRNVSGNRNQTELLAKSLDLGGRFAEQTGKFDAVIAEFLHFFQGACKISFHFVTDGIKLKRYG